VVSPGIGYELGSERLHGDVFLGYVPSSIAGRDLWSTTAKLAFAPLELRAGRGWRFQPLVAGFQLTYTFGSRYFVSSPDRYPPDYYKVPTALHSAVLVGGNVHHSIGRSGRRLGIYWEAVMLGTMLRLWAENPETLGLADVASLALGAWLRF